MVQVTNRGKSGTAFPPGDAVKAVTKSEHQHHVPHLRGHGGVWGGCAPLRSWKNAFLKLNSRDLVNTFWQHFAKKIV